MLQTITVAYATLFGLCFGSFANVVIYRLPRGESIVMPPSHCPACGRRLSAADLVPVLSWLFLRGHCRYCGAPVAWRYPAVETACAALFAGMAVYTGPQLHVVPLCALAFMLLCVAVIDYDTQEIPDGLLIFGAVTGILWIGASYLLHIGAPSVLGGLLGAIAGALPLLLIDRISLLLLKKDGFGYGDVKLMAVAGLYLGWALTLTALLFAVVGGGIIGAILLTRQGKNRNENGTYMPFGPFLAAGVLASLWFGERFLAALFWF